MIRVAKILEEVKRQLPYPPVSWPLPEKFRAPYPEIEWQWKHQELFHVLEVETAIEHWLDTRSLPLELTADAKFFLRARVERSLEFVVSHYAGGTCPAAPAELDPAAEKELLHWLLFPWWETHGRSIEIHEWIFEAWEMQFDP